MNNVQNIDGVLFDMDGLLLDTERVYFEGFKRTRTRFDLEQDDAIFMSLIGTGVAEGDAMLQNALNGHVDIVEFNTHWDHEIRALLADAIPLKAGVKTVLDHLQATNIPFAIATSTPTEKAKHHLGKAGIWNYFDHLVGGDQVTNGKPAPDIYIKAAGVLNIAPQNCAAFEDSENGVRAATSAGTVTVQVPDLKQPSAELLTLNHKVADDLIIGLQMVGLMPVDTP